MAGAFTDPHPLKPPDTSSPRSTLNDFMDNMNRAYRKSLDTGYKNEMVHAFLDRSAECLDLSEIASNLVQDFGGESALMLKEIFDRIQLPPVNEIPDKKAVALKGLSSWTVPQTSITIVNTDPR
jgi:MscS family membrane protein